jgi:uncharacterized protein DUF6489
MDITINLNLSPAEARALMGLPDVQPLQDAVLKRIHDRVTAQADLFSVDGQFDMWFGGKANPAMDALRGVVGVALSQGLTGGKATASGKETGPK